MKELKKILIADDYKELIRLYRLMLGSGYEVIEAWDGEDAVEKYKEHRPDLTLMDIKMPKKNGSEAIKEILEFDPDANIVAITAYGYLEEDLRVEVLRKGFGRKEFLQMVKRRLGKEGGGYGSGGRDHGKGGKPAPTDMHEEMEIRKWSPGSRPFITRA